MARTRSASAHKKVLSTAIELVAERGIDATSMDAIAQKSGVSKATIYKHWADKEALLLEMLAEANGLHRRPSFDTGNTKADLAAVLSHRPPEDCGRLEKLTTHFAAYSATHREFGAAWRHVVMEPPRRELRHLLKVGIDKGELSPQLDIELSLGLLLGPILYWHIFLREKTQNLEDLSKRIVQAFWLAYGLKQEPRKPKGYRSASSQAPAGPSGK